MTFPSINWLFEVNEFIKIVYAQAVESDIQMQPLMLLSACKLIETAKKYNGRPFEPQPLSASKGALTVHFALIFLTINDIYSFLGELQNKT